MMRTAAGSRPAADAELHHAEIEDGHEDDPPEQRQPQPMPGEPYHAQDRRPEMEAVANECKAVGRREIGAVRNGGVDRVDRHRTLRRKSSNQPPS